MSLRNLNCKGYPFSTPCAQCSSFNIDQNMILCGIDWLGCISQNTFLIVPLSVLHSSWLCRLSRHYGDTSWLGNMSDSLPSFEAMHWFAYNFLTVSCSWSVYAAIVGRVTLRPAMSLAFTIRMMHIPIFELIFGANLAAWLKLTHFWTYAGTFGAHHLCCFHL